MTYILGINETARTKQVDIKQYMDSTSPNINHFVDDLDPFQYNDVWFYPVSSEHKPEKTGISKVHGLIHSNDWCVDFSKSIGYDYDSFYSSAKKYGYGKCDVFACRVDGKIHYMIPISNKFAEFPMLYASGDNETFIKLLDDKLNNIFNKVE